MHEIDCNTLKLFYSKYKTCIYIQVERKERENYFNFIFKIKFEILFETSKALIELRFLLILD